MAVCLQQWVCLRGRLSTAVGLSSWPFVYNSGSGFFVFVCLFVFVPATTAGLFLRLSTAVVMFLCLSTTVGMFLCRTITVGPVFLSVNSSGSDFVSVYKSGPVFVSVYNSRIVFVVICLQRRVCFNGRLSIRAGLSWRLFVLTPGGSSEQRENDSAKQIS